MDPDDPVLEDYTRKFGSLAGVEFQRAMERRAAVMGGGNLSIPVQRVTDFLAQRDLPEGISIHGCGPLKVEYPALDIDIM